MASDGKIDHARGALDAKPVHFVGAASLGANGVIFEPDSVTLV